MLTRLTTKDFIDRARAVHGDKYGYVFSIYQSTHKKLSIHCPEHGVFEQTPHSHLKGKGCPSCSGNERSNKEDFIKKAKAIHGEKYVYTFVNYTNAYTKVTIKCIDHGLFSQKPNSHLSGSGCSKCGELSKTGRPTLTTSAFINQAEMVHGGKYDYSQVDYVNAITKVSIKCQVHKLFSQTPSSHLQGRGCPKCSSFCFNRTENGFLYVLRSYCGQYMKIGITNNPDQRHAQLSKATPFKFECIELIEGRGGYIAELEKRLLLLFEPIKFTQKFDGHTEWRVWSDNIRGYLKNEFKK